MAAKPNANPDDEAQCYAEYSEAAAVAARHAQSMASMLKRFANMGVDTKGIKESYKRSKSGDPSGDHIRLTAMMGRLGIIEVKQDAKGQWSFAEAFETAKPSAEKLKLIEHGKIKSDGYNAGYHGYGHEVCIDHVPGSEGHVIWMAAWREGEADKNAFKPEGEKTKKASTTRKRATADA